MKIIAFKNNKLEFIDSMRGHSGYCDKLVIDNRYGNLLINYSIPRFNDLTFSVCSLYSTFFLYIDINPSLLPLFLITFIHYIRFLFATSFSFPEQFIFFLPHHFPCPVLPRFNPILPFLFLLFLHLFLLFFHLYFNHTTSHLISLLIHSVSGEWLSVALIQL